MDREQCDLLDHDRAGGGAGGAIHKDAKGSVTRHLLLSGEWDCHTHPGLINLDKERTRMELDGERDGLIGAHRGRQRASGDLEVLGMAIYRHDLPDPCPRVEQDEGTTVSLLWCEHNQPDSGVTVLRLQKLEYGAQLDILLWWHEAVYPQHIYLTCVPVSKRWSSDKLDRHPCRRVRTARRRWIGQPQNERRSSRRRARRRTARYGPGNKRRASGRSGERRRRPRLREPHTRNHEREHSKHNDEQRCERA